MKYRITCCLLIMTLLICVYGAAYAQLSKPTLAGDVKQIKQLLARANSLADSDSKAALVLVNQAKTLCVVVKIDTLTAKARDQEAFCNFYAGNYKRAALLFDSAASIWKTKNKLNYFKALNDKATSLMYNSEYHKALLVFFECLELSKTLNNKGTTGNVLTTLAWCTKALATPIMLYAMKSNRYHINWPTKIHFR